MQLPKGWETITFGDAFEYEPKTGVKAGEGTSSGKYKFFTSSSEQTKRTDNFSFEGEHLIFATGGKAGIHHCNEKFGVSNDCFVVKSKQKDIYVKYVYYFFRGNMHILEHGFRGAGLKHMRSSYLDAVKIPKPPYETQKKIASLLEKAEKLKGFRTDADKLTDELLTSVFYEMFGDPVKNEKRWEKKKLADFGEIRTGNTPSRKKPEYYGNYIEWIKSDNLNTPYTYLTKSKEMLSKEGASVGRLAPKRSVLVTCIAGSISCIGNTGIADRDVAFNQQINAIIPKKDVNELFLYYLILNTKKYIQNSSTQAMKGMISKSTFENISFIYPHPKNQARFGEVAKSINRLMLTQTQSKQSIDDLFNALMQKAFRGELGVS